jgi:hypothetical protein
MMPLRELMLALIYGTVPSARNATGADLGRCHPMGGRRQLGQGFRGHRDRRLGISVHDRP